LSAVSVFDSENLGVKNALYFQAITDIEVERYGSAVIIRILPIIYRCKLLNHMLPIDFIYD